jgi:hypothetical protein
MEGQVIVSLVSVGLLFGVALWITAAWRSMPAHRHGFFLLPVARSLRAVGAALLEFLGLLALSFLLVLAFILSWGRRR